MLRIVMNVLSWLVISYSVFSGSMPVFMMGFILAALANGAQPSGVLSMAVVKGMNFTRGKLGNVGFRQQYVKEKGGYRRRTVAFQLPETVANPRTTGQVRQRTKFRLIQAIASALSAKQITYNFYKSGRGISGYNAFIRDGLADAIVEMADGTPFVDWKQLKVTKGDFLKEVRAYRPQTLKDDDCNCARLLAWNYDWTCDPDGNAYALNLIGIKMDAEGAIEDVVCVQPRVPLGACQTEVLLPKCDCCKTYWYAFFIDPYTGYFSSSAYIGTCDCTLPEFDPASCITCNNPAPIAPVEPPSECPTHCGDHEMTKMEREQIVYQGLSKVPSGFSPSNMLLYGACPLLQVMAEVDENLTYQASNASEGVSCVVDNNGLVVAEWSGTGNGDADWSEDNDASNAMTALGYQVVLDTAGGVVNISNTNGRKLAKLIINKGTEKEKIFLFNLVPNTEILTFMPSPLDAIEHMLVIDGNGTTHFDGDPNTLVGGMLYVEANFDNGGSQMYHVHLKPIDTNCPTAVLLYEFDGDSIELIPPAEGKDKEDDGKEVFEENEVIPANISAEENC